MVGPNWSMTMPIAGMKTMPPAGRSAANSEFKNVASSSEVECICGYTVAMKKLMQIIVTEALIQQAHGSETNPIRQATATVKNLSNLCIPKVDQRSKTQLVH